MKIDSFHDSKEAESSAPNRYTVAAVQTLYLLSAGLVITNYKEETLINTNIVVYHTASMSCSMSRTGHAKELET